MATIPSSLLFTMGLIAFTLFLTVLLCAWIITMNKRRRIRVMFKEIAIAKSRNQRPGDEHCPL